MRHVAPFLVLACACGDDGQAVSDAAAVVDAARFDAAVPDSPTATNILVVASGMNAPLIGSLPAGSGTDFVVDATLGDMRVRIQNGNDRSWSCSQPDDQFPNFDLFSFRTGAGGYYFKLSVRPQDWSPGVKPIDGTNISVYIGNAGPEDPPTPDTVRGTAISGTVNLFTTPATPCTVPGLCTPEQICAFSIENVDLVFSNGT